jgi:hypothetical protein
MAAPFMPRARQSHPRAELEKCVISSSTDYKHLRKGEPEVSAGNF